MNDHEKIDQLVSAIGQRLKFCQRCSKNEDVEIQKGRFLEENQCRGCGREICVHCKKTHALDPDEEVQHVRYDEKCPCRRCACENEIRQRETLEIEQTASFTAEALPAPPSMPQEKVKAEKPSFWSKKQLLAMNAYKKEEEEEREEHERRSELAIKRAQEDHKTLNQLVERPETLHRISAAERKRLASQHRGELPLRVDYVDPERLDLWQIVEDTLAKQFGTKNVGCHKDIRTAFDRKFNPVEVPLMTFTSDDFVTVRFNKRTPVGLLRKHTIPYWETKGYPPVMLQALELTCEQAFQSDEKATSERQRQHLLKIGLPDAIVSGLDAVIKWLIVESERVIDVEQYAKLLSRGLAKETINALIEVVQPVWETGEIDKIEAPILFKNAIPLESIPIVKDVYGLVVSLRFTFPANGSNAESHQIIAHMSKLLLVLRTPAKSADMNMVEYWYAPDEKTGIYQIYLRWNNAKDFARQFNRVPTAPFELKVDTYTDRLGAIAAKGGK